VPSEITLFTLLLSNSMVIRNIQAKSILSVSKVYDYVVNPYVGCQFGCLYCYARYMKKFTGHKEPWGTFVDSKDNAAVLLQKEIAKKKKGLVWISGVCDPYQPLEKKYAITRACLTILIENDWPVIIQTKSNLVLRDVDIIKNASSCDVGLSITTANDSIRKLFEPQSTAIADRIDAIKQLKKHGIRTYVMIAPMLPGCENLIDMLAGSVDYVYVDKMNYHYADSVYKKYALEQYCDNSYFFSASHEIAYRCEKEGIACSIV